jgi:hypothetical protein
MEHAPCRDLQWAERVHGAGFDRLTGLVAGREQLQPVSNLPSREGVPALPLGQHAGVT